MHIKGILSSFLLSTLRFARNFCASYSHPCLSVVLNMEVPLWPRESEEVTHDRSAAFCKSLCAVGDDHLAMKHFSVDGRIEFRSLLSVPCHAPFGLFKTKQKCSNVKLHVCRVLSG